jgi:hypothetical protein
MPSPFTARLMALAAWLSADAQTQTQSPSAAAKMLSVQVEALSAPFEADVADEVNIMDNVIACIKRRPGKGEQLRPLWPFCYSAPPSSVLKSPIQDTTQNDQYPIAPLGLVTLIDLYSKAAGVPVAGTFEVTNSASIRSALCPVAKGLYGNSHQPSQGA